MVSSKIFSSLDNYMWQLTYKWATHTHPTKPKKWIARRYFGKFNKFRNDRWVFGARRLIHACCHRGLQARQHNRKPVTQPATP